MTFEEYIKKNEPSLVSVTQQLWNPANRSHINALRRLWDSAIATRDEEIKLLKAINATLEKTLSTKQSIDVRFSIFGTRK